MRGRYLCLIVATALLVTSCARVASPEQSVYEALWAKTSLNHPVKFIAATTDSRWFVENKLSDVVADGTRVHGSEEPWLKPEYVPLLEELYRANTRDEPLGWRPSERSVVVLEGAFFAKPRDKEVGEMCLSPTGKGTIGVADASLRRSYRPYYSLSRVAFNPDKSLAMVKYGLACAPMSGGHEALAVFKRTGESWVLVGGQLLWIS